MSAARVLIEIERGVATVALNRPQQRNALDRALVEELSGALERLGADAGLRALVLRGAGPSFCAGADLAEMRQLGGADPAVNRAAAQALAGLLRRLYDFPRPTLARVHGAAIGGAVGLVAACDIAIAADTTQFGFSEVRLGLLPAVISPYLMRKAHPARLRALMLTGERFGAELASAIGLIQPPVPEAELDAEVGRVIDGLLEGGPEAQAAIKQLLETVPRLSLEQAEPYCSEALAQRRASTEGQAGLQAFLSKSKPPWSPT
ncbi:MAG TPA: enoyl-CoA hydratase-related protein [Acidobacteriota bacterium]